MPRTIMILLKYSRSADLGGPVAEPADPAEGANGDEAGTEAVAPPAISVGELDPSSFDDTALDSAEPLADSVPSSATAEPDRTAHAAAAAAPTAGPSPAVPTATSRSSRARQPRPNAKYDDYIGGPPKRKLKASESAAPRAPPVRKTASPPVGVAVGDTIEYKWPSTQEWFVANVRKLKPPNKYTLFFPEDGERFVCALDEKNWRRIVE